MKYITSLLFATAVLADYYIDNANTSILYAFPATQSGLAWTTYSVSTAQLVVIFPNSTGSYNVTLDASNCYDQNYAQGACGTTDSNCFVQIPFTGSGITMYVFNAGSTGMTASFSVDGGQAVTESIDAPLPPSHQVSNVSLYDIQGLPTGSHTIKMALLDWNGSPTILKFDYARVNESFVASPTTSSVTSVTSRTSSQAPTQTSVGNSAPSPSVNTGGIVGAALGGFSLCVVLVIGFFYLRKRRTTPRVVPTPESTLQIHPFQLEYDNPTPPRSLSVPNTHQRSFHSLHQKVAPSVTPRVRSSILHDAPAGMSFHSSGLDQSSQSIGSGRSSAVLQPTPRVQPLPPNAGADSDIRRNARPNADSPLLGPDMASRYNLTTDQVEVVERLRADDVPLDTIARVVEGFVTSNLSGGERLNERELARGRSFASAAPPPSYQSDG